MNKKKIVKISAVVASVVVILVAGIVGVNAYIRHRNVVETGNLLGVEWYNETDPQFTITTVEQLYELAELSDFYNFKGQTIKLGADLVVNEGNAEAWAEDAPAKRWNPITGFAGTFDGQNHTISGLYGKGFERRMALFADTEMSCSVKNLSLTNSYFETTGHRGTASIVSHGGGKFKKIYSDAIIVHKGENVGGIASSIDVQSTFEECWFDGKINITNRDCGGIIDEVLGARVTVKHCLFSGYIYSSYDVGGTRTGGIFGRTDKAATIVLNDSLSSGTIECEKKVYTGSMLGASYNGVQFTIEDTYVSMETYGAVIGESGKKGTFTGTALQMRESELTGVKAYQWTTLNFDSYWAVVEGGTPILKCFAETVPSLEGVKKVYDTSWYIQGGFDFTLMTREQLYGFFIKSASTDYKDCKVKLGADIVVNEGDASKWEKEAPEMPWFPIATFAGQFDGQGHTISGLYTKTSSSYVGLFGQATAPSIIQNVSLKNSYFEKTDTSAAFMGSIVGDTYGIVQNIYSNAIIVSEGSQVGGIVGRLNDNDKTMSNMRIDGEDYSVMSNCWFDGSIKMLAWEEENTGACEAGGLVGRVVQGDAIIEHCLNTGTISSEVTGRALMVGGLVGYVVNAGQLQITDCLNVGEIKADYTICVGSVIGRANTAERIVTVKDTYATKESYKIGISKNSLKATIKGDVISVDKSWIVGNKGYQFTTLDFDKYWTVVVGPDGTPILSQFATKKPSVKGLAKMVDTSWYKADAKEMVIDSVADLYGLAMLSSTNNFEGQTIKLAADIAVNPVDASIVATWVKGTVTPQNGWMTIGSSAKPFAGTFDGQGHTISGVYSVTDEQYNGLFGVTTPTSMIKNLSLKDSYFAFNGNNLTEEGKEAAAYMGSIAGDLRGDMDTVYSNAIVTSTANQVGGLVGRANGAKDADDKLTTSTINNCWFDGKVMLTGETARYAGGIAGVAVQGTVEFKHCLNSGSVSNERLNGGQFLGGVVGTEWAENTIVNIDNCLNTGVITPKYNNCIGSIVGRIQKKGSTFNITNTYASKESCVNASGKPTTVGGSIATGAKQKGTVGTIYENMIVGYGGYEYTMLDFDKYWTVVVNPDATPILKTFADSTPSLEGIESVQDWYSADAKTMEIDSATDLYGFSILSETTDFAGQTVKLTKTIGLDPTVEWIPIGSTSKPFAGTFDGGMNTITGMYVDNTTAYIGMFAVTSPSSMVKNFYLEDSEFIYSGPSMQYNEEKQKEEETGAYMGSIVGDLRGDLDTVYSSAKVESVAMQVGGLVGRANAMKVDGKNTTCTINNCWFDGQVILTGEVARYAGGIAGVTIQGDIEITNTLNTGTVSNERLDGGVFLGGFIGTDWGKSTIKISDSISVGKITAANVNCIGSIMGRVQKSGSEVTITNTYAMKGCCTKADGTTDVSVWSAASGTTVTNKTVFISESELLGVEAYKWTNLNFDATGKWVARSEEIPRLKSFAKKGEEKSVAGVIKPDTAWYDNAAKDATDYYIGAPEELLGFAKLYNSGNVFKGKTIHLTHDIRLNPKNVVTDYVNGTSDKEPDNRWAPGGNNTVSTQFAGTFDGQGHTISGIYTVSDSSYIGLFGVIADGSVVKDLRITDSYFYSSNTGNAMIGSVAGECRGTIDSVYSEAIVESTGDRVGGLVGMASGPKPAGKSKYGTATINNSWFNGNINLLDGATNSGGVIGLTMQGNVNVTNCLVTGTLNNAIAKTDGGLIGYVGNAGAHNMVVNISDNLVALKEEVANANVGTVIGTIKNNDNGTTFTRSYTIINTYVAKESFGGNSIIADNKEDDTTAVVGTAFIKPKADLQGTKGYENTLLDFYVNADDKGEWVARSGKVPALKTFVGTVVAEAEVENLGSASQTGWYDDSIHTYYIGTISAFKAFRDYVNGGKTFKNKVVYLADDMDLNPGWTAPKKATDTVTGSPNWTPIGNDSNKFQGTFDGQGHEIKGIYVTGDTTLLGLFGGVDGANSMVMNLRLTNSYVEHTGETAFVGGVVGYLNKGTIHQVYCKAIVKSNGTQFGGIVGRAEGLVEECWFDGEVYADRTDATYVQAAGIVGTSWSQTGTGKTFTPLTIRNCLNTGKVIYNVTTTSGAGAGLGGIYGGDRGYTDLTVADCVNIGIIETNQKNGTGSIVGNISKNTTIDKVATYSTADIVNCYAATNSITTRKDGRIFGYKHNNCDVTQTANVTKDVEAMKGDVVYKDVSEGGLDLDYGVWVARTSDVPVPRCFVGTVVDKSAVAEDKTGRVYADTSWLEDNAGTESDPYQLDSAGDFLGFAQLVNDGMNFQSLFVELTADIDMNAGWTVIIDEQTGKISGKAPKNIWTPIGGESTSVYFNGKFNGNGHTISGIYIDTKSTGYTGFVGLFGYAMAASQIENFQLVNSYIESGNANTGSVVGRFGGTMNNVYSNATVFGVSTTGGLVGLYTEGGNKTIQKCWFDGTVTAVGSVTYCGGIVACTDKTDKTKTIKNCLNTGTVVCEYAGTNDNVATATGGIAGGNKTGTLKVENCLNLGSVSTPKDTNRTKQNKGTAAIVGYNAKNHHVTIQDSYYTNSEWNALGFNNNTASDATGTVTLKLNGKNVSSLTSNTMTELTGANAVVNAPYLGISDSGAWTTLKVQENNQVKEMTPILKDFKAWWLDKHNYTKNLLMIGNSFSYYYVEELYGIAEAAGVHLNIYNVYYSGCSLEKHWNWLQNDEKNYEFYVTNADGRRALSGNVGLKQCLAVADWDIISLQQASTTYIDTVDTAKALTEPYAEELYGYLREKFPNARYLWHQTWSSQIGYQHATDANNKVADRQTQKLRDANAVGLANYICQKYAVDNVPSGSAWDIARENVLIGDTLCNRVDASGTDNTDKHHDGNVGGGQYLNACVWFETLTGKSCVGNAYRPDYDLSEEKIAVLQQSAHKAVKAIYGETQ